MLKNVLWCVLFSVALAPLDNARGDVDSGVPIYIPEGVYLFWFCKHPSAVCINGKPDREVYGGMSGVLNPVQPVKVEHGKNVFKFNMANGDTLYRATEGSDPIDGKVILSMERHQQVMASVGSPLQPDSPVRITSVFREGIIGYKYELSTGQVFWGGEFQDLRRFMKNVPPEKHSRFLKSSEDITIKYDDMEQRYFLHIKDPGDLPLRPYIGYAGGRAWLRFKVFYKADSWLFAERVLVRADDVREDLRMGRFQRDHTGGTIWEYADVSATEEHLALISQVVQSSKAVVRFYGRQYYADRDVSELSKKKLGSLMEIYKML